MTEMTIEEIQKVSLEILRHIDSFCREHNIQYFLDSGTLIGAARHKGFIPWDDDMDIRMPRPDYERFISEFVDENFKIRTIYGDKVDEYTIKDLLPHGFRL